MALAQYMQLPKLGLGTYKLTGAEGEKAMIHALELGYKHLDTAQMYENEKEVGQALKKASIQANDIFITTKIWPANFSRLVSATEESLRNLKLECVDLLLLHWPAENISATKKGIEALNKVLHKGYAKQVGVSNFNIELIQTSLSMAPVKANQVEYHPFLSQDKLLSFMREKEMELIAYYPLAHGRVAEDETIKALGKKYGKTPGQIALRWLIQQKNVSAIPKSSNPGRQQENLDISDFELTDTDMQSIFALNGNKHFVNTATSPEWDS